MNQEETENVNRPIRSTKKKKICDWNLPTERSPGPDGFTGKFYEMFNVYEMLTPTLLKLSQKVAEERILPSSFYETTITLINETRQRYHKKGNYRPVSLMNIDRDPQ